LAHILITNYRNYCPTETFHLATTMYFAHFSPRLSSVAKHVVANIQCLIKMKTLPHACMPNKNHTNIHGLNSSFWITHLGLSLLLAFVMLWIYPKTNLDYLLIQAFFDSSQQAFTWQHHWLFEKLMHTGLKYAVIIIAISTFGLSVVSSLKRPLHSLTRPTLWTFCAMVVATSIISLLKSQSIHA
jgi:membrane-associated PAP2 superfamily phosphatase